MGTGHPAQVTYHRGLTLAQESPVHEIFNMLLAVFDRAALMLFCLFFLIRIRLFRELLHKSAHSPKELLAVTAIFSMFALFSTWSGVPVEGSLVNVRIIAVMSGGFCLVRGSVSLQASSRVPTAI